MKELMRNDCAALDMYFTEPWETPVYLITDCEGNEFTYYSLPWAKKKYEKITKAMTEQVTAQ
jgi:hypothetical protein